MDFSLSSDQILIRDTVRQFMETEMRPILREYERAEKFPADQLKKLGELGCCGMLIPEEWSGAGTDTVSYALMLEEVARVDASTAVALSVTNSVVAVPLWKSRSEAQKKKYLRRLATGEILGAFCLTEPQAGSDAAGIQTRAVRDGDHYLLNGTKAWVTNGGVSGLYIVFAKTDPAAGSRGVSAFLVEPDFPGFRISRYEDKMGLRLSRSAEISLQDCRVPAENRLGEEGQGLRIALESLDGGRIGIAAQSVGLAQGALEAATRYAKQRKTFGHPIAEYQAIQWMLADMETEVSAARALTHYAAWQRDKELRDQEARGREVTLHKIKPSRRPRCRKPPAWLERLACKTVCQRNGESRSLQSGPSARQQRLFARNRRRALLSRRPRPHNLRRHQRNAAPGNRPRPAAPLIFCSFNLRRSI